MMAPQEGDDEIVGMSKHFDVGVADWFKIKFDEFWIVIDCYFGLLIDYDVDFDIFFR